MKIFAVSNSKEGIKNIKDSVKDTTIKYSRFSPNIIFCLGGDGTFLYAERKYPGVPKILIWSDKRHNKKGRYNLKSIKRIISKIENHEFKFIKEKKLKLLFNGKEAFAVNDVSIRNKIPNCGIRFSTKIGKKKYENLIGDGITVSNPYGSTGYFHSITGKSFSEGLGVAMNNVTKKITSKIIKKGIVNFELIRGTALLCVDNNPKIITLKSGDRVRITNSSQVAKIVELV